MSLTKRLYRLDEVRAALLFCIKSRRLYEACFWLRELEDSELQSEARQILFLSWFLVYGLSTCSWIFAWAENANSRQGRLKLCWQLCRCSERDTSLWWILCAGVVYSNPKDQLSVVFDQWRSRYHIDHEEFWQPLVDASNLEPVDLILEQLQENMGKYILYARLAGLVLVASQKHISKSSWGQLSQEEPIELLQYLTEWNSSTSLRATRAFAIPQSSLYGITWRGCGGTTTEELRNLNLKQLLKSPGWKNTLVPYTTAGQWNSDDDHEAFYDTWFNFATCDIPDEWSSTDQEKSHGTYPLIGDQAPLWKWWNSWIGGLPHKWIWGTVVDQVAEWTKTVDLNKTGAIVELVAKLYSQQIPVYIGPPKKKEWILSIPPLVQK